MEVKLGHPRIGRCGQTPQECAMTAVLTFSPAVHYRHREEDIFRYEQLDSHTCNLCQENGVSHTTATATLMPD